MTADPNRVSATEQSLTAQLGAVLFRHRGWLPLIFLAIPLVMPGSMTPFGWEVGIALIIIGEAIRLAGVAAAGTVTRRRSRNVQRLVTYGIFAWARNPLYIGNFLIWMGFVTISGVLWFLPFAVLLLAFWIKSRVMEGCVAGSTVSGCFAWGSGGFSIRF